ncbi:MAG: flagellar basal body L-ring protein FlgH [Bryobacteraceae bacterium]
MTSRISAIFLILGVGMGSAAKKPPKPVEPSPLDRYIQQSLAVAPQPGPAENPAGSTWNTSSRFLDLGSDVRASQVNDLVTILVAEQASAVSSGATKTARQSNAKSSITAAGGITRAAGPWANLLGTSTQTQLDGQGTTSRQTSITTTLSARVTHVLPNGYLVIEGSKELQINSEHQTVTIRGVVRPVDLDPANIVQSNRVAQMEIRVNGKGVVGDAVRRPFILYRILMGLLPF